MKNSTKTTVGPITHALRQRMDASPNLALDELAWALKNDESKSEFDRAAILAVSVGLFVLGIDKSGDAGLGRVVDALYGKDSENAAAVFNAIVSAGDLARDTMVNAQRASRRQRDAERNGKAA